MVVGCCVGGACGTMGGLLGALFNAGGLDGKLVVALALADEDDELLVTLFVVGGHDCRCMGSLLGASVSCFVVVFGVVGGLL